MKIEAAELRVVRLELLQAFETSMGTQSARDIPILILFGEGLEGYAEGVMEEAPLYREEYVSGALTLIKDHFLPRILGFEFASPEEIWDRLAMVRGNRMAKAVIEMACWDLWSKCLGLPLCRVLGGNRDAVPAGVSLGIQHSLESTCDQVRSHIDRGYLRVKLKIKPGWDTQVVAAVRKEFPQATLTVDANSAYTLADVGTICKWDTFGLDYIEQPLEYDDLLDHATLQRSLNTPICLDESILSPSDTRKALEIGAARVINIKPGRVGGHREARRVHDVAVSFGVPVWCGGMLESGIGRAHNLHLATLPGFSKPGDISASSRYWKTDVINEPLEMQRGLMPVPQGNGIGVTLNRRFLDSITIERAEIRQA
jgi:o-succinylbenzoate synthase